MPRCRDARIRENLETPLSEGACVCKLDGKAPTRTKYVIINIVLSSLDIFISLEFFNRCNVADYEILFNASVQYHDHRCRTNAHVTI